MLGLGPLPILMDLYSSKTEVNGRAMPSLTAYVFSTVEASGSSLPTLPINI